MTDSCHTDTPQETALRSESQLESTRRSLIELDEDKQAGKEEAESARYAHVCYAMEHPCGCVSSGWYEL